MLIEEVDRVDAKPLQRSVGVNEGHGPLDRPADELDTLLHAQSVAVTEVQADATETDGRYL
jgi:hypothetical protein